MQNQQKNEIITFGCRLNSLESEVMRSHVLSAELESTVIVNTCAVTAEAERQARQAIRRVRRERPNARIVVTGCAVQINPMTYSAMDEVDQVLGNNDKLQLSNFLDLENRIKVNDIMSVAETAGHLVDGIEGRARAFLQVQQGCDHRCTYCVIPFGRGPSRSVGLGAIVEQAKKLVANGYREIVLTGVDITSFGGDLPGTPSLGAMTRRLLDAVPELQRLRISSIDAIEVDGELFELIAHEPRLMPHLHLSLQAGDDMILKRMKRRHNRAVAVEFCSRVRASRPDIVFGADLIVGFPTENEEMFERSLSLVEDCGLTYLHVFPYSERARTPAMHMPSVAKSVRKERAARLRKKGEEVLSKYLEAQVGRSVDVLMETPARGRTPGFALLELEGDTARPGEVLNVEIIGNEADRLKGRIST